MAQTTLETITYKQISNLGTNASMAGDYEMAEMCSSLQGLERSYTGSLPGDDVRTEDEREALAECVAAINAEGQE